MADAGLWEVGMSGPSHPDAEGSAADREERTCAKCGERPAGPGGVLCGSCLDRLTQQHDNYWSRSTGRT